MAFCISTTVSCFFGLLLGGNLLYVYICMHTHTPIYMERERQREDFMMFLFAKLCQLEQKNNAIWVI